MSSPPCAVSLSVRTHQPPPNFSKDITTDNYPKYLFGKSILDQIYRYEYANHLIDTVENCRA